MEGGRYHDQTEWRVFFDEGHKIHITLDLLVRDTAQESEMNALGSYLFHDVVNQT